jgi:Flp pilus assembly protein TadG
MIRALDPCLRFSLMRLRQWRQNRGSVAVLTALLIVPLMFTLGMAYDYTMASNRKDQIDGMADAAALGAVTPAMMMQSSATAQARATSLFNDQIATVQGVTYLPVNGAVTVTDTPLGATITRNVTVTYTALSPNIFATILGLPAFQISGSSGATSGGAPNIDFYLMMDTSPSMEIAATTAGMNTLTADTSYTSEGTCTFGCHQSNAAEMTTGSSGSCASHTDPATNRSSTKCQYVTSTPNKQIPCTASGSYADGTTFTSSSTFPETGRDNYDLSRCTGVTLRIDLLNAAAQSLMDTASTTEAANNAAYRMAIYLTDVNQTNTANDLSLYTLEPLTSDLADAKTKAATITALEVCYNNYLVCGTNNNDMDTYLDGDLSSVNSNTSLLPNPGNGTNNPGDTPQEVLVIVTDGLNDEGSPRTYPPMDWSGTNCSAIKARGIRIAVLYTQYIAGSGGSWYTSSVQPQLPTGLPPGLPPSTPNGGDPMALAAQQCASTGLYSEITTDGDISTALQALFLKAVSTARLTQ